MSRPGSTVRAFALRIVDGLTLADKLAPPEEPLDDDDPGAPLRRTAPGRPPELAIATGRVPAPAPGAMLDPTQRPRLLHAFANHELQAVELFAWALLAYPDAPPAFRRGLVGVLCEEQTHVQLYVERLAALGVTFGAYPVNAYFWGKIEHLRSPRDFVCAMGLTFENANLDHSLDYAALAHQAGDAETAALLEQIHRDEIGHVRFGWTWLERLRDPGSSMWEAYCASVTWPLRAALARGRTFHRAGREAAGLDPEFIDRLASASRDDPAP